jgi:ATP-dependent exoDNAse (exonuclease V) beta subunit
VLSLDETFRPHQALIQATGDLLGQLMAPRTEPVPPFWVSFSPSTAHRSEPRTGSVPPFIELLVGVGKNAGSGRIAAANLLVQHLLGMRSKNQINKWQDVALLFRATTNFPPYEEALDSAGIPYVTIAGRGFYDRPEVRDMLNILRAISDPWDDLAVAGLLRSPAFGLTDIALYQLRWSDGYQHDSNPANLVSALKSNHGCLDKRDKESAILAAEFLETFSQLVDRIPVAELIKRICDYTDYRTILATENNRFWRNIDKLLADAHNSRIVNVHSFLEYIQNLRNVGVREGEAPPDIVHSAGMEGAVQLMSIHKAKGLEFNIVVIADASYQGLNRSEIAYLIPETGFGIKFDRFDSPPIQYNYLKNLDSEQEKAEDKRLIYVAATRAREKLIINGHWSKRLRSCWLKDFANAAGIDLKALCEHTNIWLSYKLSSGRSISAIAAESPADFAKFLPPGDGITETQSDQHLGQGTAIYLPLRYESLAHPEEEHHPIARAIGILTHKAIQRWLYPGNQSLDRLLETTALENQLIDDAVRANAIQATKVLLERFRQHSLWAEINSSQEKHHEVSIVRKHGQRMVYRKIDLIYRNQKGWYLVDFKTDKLADISKLQSAIGKHKIQVQGYKHALQESMGIDVHSRLCFLDYMSQVELVVV